jgi:hypothetical protein
MIALASLVLTAVALMISAGKTDREDTKQQERRLCRLEAALAKGECGR